MTGDPKLHPQENAMATSKSAPMTAIGRQLTRRYSFPTLGSRFQANSELWSLGSTLPMHQTDPDVVFSARGAMAMIEVWRRFLFDPYRPELHYMRGPGPKSREKVRTSKRATPKEASASQHMPFGGSMRRSKDTPCAAATREI
jgi:hypothetical protein